MHRLDAALRAAIRQVDLDESELGQLAELVDRVVRGYERI
jgi:hypothetical protein